MLFMKLAILVVLLVGALSEDNVGSSAELEAGGKNENFEREKFLVQEAEKNAAKAAVANDHLLAAKQEIEVLRAEIKKLRGENRVFKKDVKKNEARLKDAVSESFSKGSKSKDSTPNEINECPCDPTICSKLAPPPGIMYSCGDNAPHNYPCVGFQNSDGLCTESFDGGKWLVILRHKIGKTTAFQTGLWENYAKGFGNPEVDSTSFWLGLRQVHRLTSIGKWQVLLKIKWDKEYKGNRTGPLIDDPLKGTTGYEIYNDFKVGPESDGFRLTVGQNDKRVNVQSTEPDTTFNRYNNGHQFATTDHGRQADCAMESEDGGGWWFANCSYVCLTCSPSSGFKELWVDYRYPKPTVYHIPSEFVMAIRVMN